MKTPASVQAEKALLGCALMEVGAARHCTQHIDPADFYSYRHKRILEAVEEILLDGGTPEPVRVGKVLGKDLKKCGGHEYLFEIASMHPSTVNIDTYIDEIKSASNTRKMELLCQKALADIKTTDYDTVRAALEAAIQEIGESKSPWVSTEEILTRAKEKVHFNTGLTLLDKYTKGLRTGFNLFAGEPGAGKSTLCLQIVARALQSGYQVAAISNDQDLDEQV